MLNLTNLVEVQQFVFHVIFDLDVSFHPDEDFRNYVNDDGKRSFDSKTANKLNGALQQAFSVCERDEVDICELSLPILQIRLFGHALAST